jgi:hypothetical protein
MLVKVGRVIHMAPIVAEIRCLPAPVGTQRRLERHDPLSQLGVPGTRLAMRPCG